VDASLSYTTDFMDSEVTFRADVFNVLNAIKPITFWERSEFRGANHASGGRTAGDPDTRFGSPRQYQTPRYVRLSASIAF
jgi:hypothetical protein